MTRNTRWDDRTTEQLLTLKTPPDLESTKYAMAKEAGRMPEDNKCESQHEIVPDIDPGSWAHSAISVRAALAAASGQSMEDYLERIHELIETKGYARPIEIAAALGIKPSSVTKMMRRLHEQGFAVYEKHRGLTLTLAGEEVALAIRRRHKTVSEFLRILGVDEDCLQRDTEGIEHHISSQTIARLESLVDFLNRHPDVVKAFQKAGIESE